MDPLATCDYSGIVCLIVGSCIPCVYYGFYTASFWRNAYLAAVLAMGSILLATQFLLKGARWRWTRTGLFLVLGFVELVPLVHMLLLRNFDQTSVSLCLGVVRMGSVYSEASPRPNLYRARPPPSSRFPPRATPHSPPSP
jgi:adiponectin receptor